MFYRVINVLILINMLLLSILDVYDNQKFDKRNYKKYLQHYGYVNKNPINGRTFLTNVTQALKNFQVFMHLPVTGKRDTETMKMLNRRRCGNRDPVSTILSRRVWGEYKTSYVLEGSKWTNYNLTYRINSWPKTMAQNETLDNIERAFKTWSDVTPLNFIRISDMKKLVHIDIDFKRGEHCCHNHIPDYADHVKFDGPSGNYAHTFFPQYNGDIHFDDDEWWVSNYTNDPYNERDLCLWHVATHEIGHSLGLDHTDMPDAIMAPAYHHYSPFRLHRLDIDGIQVLYGKSQTNRSMG